MFGRLGTPLIAIVVIMSVAIYWAVTILRSSVNVSQERKANDLGDELAHREMDTLHNIQTVKTFGRVDGEIREYERLQEEACQMRISFERTNEYYSLLTTFVQNGSTVAALALAAAGASNGSLTVGDFVLINSYIAQLYRPLVDLSRAYTRITESAANVEKVIKMFKKRPTIVDASDARDVSNVQGSITFDRVSFKYTANETSRTILKDISFHVPPGGVLGIVGHAGSGKSTIVKLATRLFDVEDGEGVVEIDGVDIKKYKINAVRSLFGVVSQRTSLFHTSIKKVYYSRRSKFGFGLEN